MRRRSFASALAAALLLPLAGPVAHAEDYPARPIRMYIGLAAGGGADLICRYFAEALGKLAGQPVVVENKPGAGGNIATQAVSTAKPDGYTLLFSTSNTLTGNFYLYKNLSFTIDDFAPVTTLAKAAFALVVSGTSDIHSVAELTARLKAANGLARYGSPTSISLAAAETYMAQQGVTARRIPYKAAALAMNELKSGELDFFFMDATAALAPARRGEIRILAVTTNERIGAAPDIPTMQEAGVAGFDMTAWFGVFVPAGTPQDIRHRLAGWLNQIVREPETRDFLLRGGADPFPGSAEALMQMVRAQTEAYRRLSESGKLDAAH
jgi:tripartite-type tricarboxylate transporter receptor subunit TctC